MLAFCVIIAFFLLLYFSFAKRSMIMVTNKICIADFIDLLGSGSFMNIMLIPLSAFFTTTLSEHNCSSLILKRFAKIFISSVAITVLVLLVSVLTAGLFTAEIINWNKYESYFYLSTKMLFDIDFVDVMLFSFAKLFFPISFFSSLACTIRLVCKKTFSFLIIVLISATNIFGYIKLIIDNTFNYHFASQSYLSFSSVVLIFIIFPLLTLITVLAAVKLAKRKDFLN